jgi:CRP-like cAMP-binding protein
MAVKRPVVAEKKDRKTSVNLGGPLRPQVDTPHKGTPAFDPRLFLTKHAAGNTSREYQPEESVFSQGDEADAVFYIQSGKVKLTVVSKRGKEAVVAILPEATFLARAAWRASPSACPVRAQSSEVRSFGSRSR